MKMQDQVKNFIFKQKLFNQTDKLLVGVSGGKDSIALIHMLVELKFQVAIAHCNFNLRGAESDGDEAFVCELAKNLNIPYFSIQFNTEEFAKKNGISIEMAARDIRYEWFQEVLEKEKYQYICTGHHHDDQVETVLNNLARGTGISGLHGIRAKRGNILRPFLSVNREDINTYIEMHQLDYREDSSNASTKFMRNLIRKEIVPLFEKINPSFNKTMKENIERFNEIEKLIAANIENNKTDVMWEQKGQVFFSIENLKKLKPTKLFLYEYLKEYNFTGTTIDDIFNSLDGISGKQFYSNTHCLVKDREELILTPLNTEINKEISIEEDKSKITTPINLEFKRYPKDKLNLRKDPNLAFLDEKKVSFPLVLRRWEKGDSFHPFGMKGKKKLSDLFIDHKLSIIEKENIWLLCSGKDIMWVVGLRIDNRYAIDKTTNTVLQISLIQHDKNQSPTG